MVTKQTGNASPDVDRAREAIALAEQAHTRIRASTTPRAPLSSARYCPRRTRAKLRTRSYTSRSTPGAGHVPAAGRERASSGAPGRRPKRGIWRETRAALRRSRRPGGARGTGGACPVT
ncbi:MAG: hypothetical protein HY332_05400 [Chloroflexi bacterium]|nr:hypothetical protein [Chloroflexota bacterium]